MTKKLEEMTIKEKRGAYKEILAEALALGCTKAEVRAYVEKSLQDSEDWDDRPSADIALEAIDCFVVMVKLNLEQKREAEEEAEDYGPSLHDAKARDDEAAYARFDDHYDDPF